MASERPFWFRGLFGGVMPPAQTERRRVKVRRNARSIRIAEEHFIVAVLLGCLCGMKLWIAIAIV